MNEDVTVKIGDDGKVEVKHDGKEVDTITPDHEEVLTGGEMGEHEDMPITVSDEETPIVVHQESNIEEMQNMAVVLSQRFLLSKLKLEIFQPTFRQTSFLLLTDRFFLKRIFSIKVFVLL